MPTGKALYGAVLMFGSDARRCCGRMHGFPPALPKKDGSKIATGFFMWKTTPSGPAASTEAI